MFFQLIPPNTHFNFLGHRRKFIAGSIAMVVVGIVAAFARGGPPVGIDFAGGTEVQLRFDPGVTVDESSLRDVARGAGFLDATVVRFDESDATDFIIKFKALPGAPEGGEGPAGLEANTRVARLESTIREKVGGFKEQRVEFVGAKVGSDLRRDGLMAMVLAWVAILIYVAFQFSAAYAPGGVIALIHDVIITAGILVVFNVEFDLQVLAALLAIIGYSLNDTIIIYDRIRENRKARANEDLEEVLNLSVNQTLSRTVLTSALTMLAVLSLLFFGGEVIRPFTLTMLIGIVIGSYSSIFIAAPLLLYLEQRYGAKAKDGQAGGGRGTPGRPVGAPKNARA